MSPPPIPEAPSGPPPIPQWCAAPHPGQWPARLSPSDEKLICVLIHALPIMFWFLGPLILWLVKKDESAAVNAHGKEALNFHLSFLLYYFACALLMIPAALLTFGLGAIPLMPLFFVLIIGHLVCCILGAVQASEGRLFRYPLAIRFIS